MAARLPDYGYDENIPLVEFAPMRKRHLSDVLAIESAAYPRPWTMSLFVSELSLRTHRHYVVAKLDDVIVGYAGLMFALDEAHITTIAVEPRLQRHKIGTQIMLHLLYTARGHDAAGMTLEVRVSNEPAQGLYRKFGFFPSGIRKNYYTEIKEDALIMWVEDLGSDGYDERLRSIAAELSPTAAIREWKV